MNEKAKGKLKKQFPIHRSIYFYNRNSSNYL